MFILNYYRDFCSDFHCILNVFAMASYYSLQYMLILLNYIVV